MPARSDIVFLFIGGAHQVFHLAPVAAALSRREDMRVTCLYADTATGAALRTVAASMTSGMALLHIPVPPWAAWLARTLNRWSITKIPLLLRLAPHLRQTTAIVTPERTSSFLRRLGIARPLLVHFFHGAGDRALASDKRLAAFDVIVVAGGKDLARTAAIARRPTSRLEASGYIKLDYLTRYASPPPRLFDNDRPTVLYNPHFDPAVSSWPVACTVVAAFAAQDRYNLIVAPHLRLAQNLAPAQLANWQALAVPGKIIIDFTSPRLIDMSHVSTVDIYLGDVSSQLYEFLDTPRPAVFIDAHAADWRTDPRYINWYLGEVITPADDLIAALDRARANHAALIERQQAAVRDAFGDYTGAIERGAAIVADVIATRHGEIAMLT